MEVARLGAFDAKEQAAAAAHGERLSIVLDARAF
jgi:hypothetical protein